MTLIISEVSRHGIAMAADSAVTFSGRAYLGQDKIQQIPEKQAGLAVWGLGHIGKIDKDKKRDDWIYTDIWLHNFIKNDVKSTMSLWQVAERLASKMNDAFGDILSDDDDRMGVHVCGFDDYEGGRGPAVYHVNNGNFHYEISEGEFLPAGDEPMREFRADRAIPPKAWPVDGRDVGVERHGDIFVFGWLECCLTYFSDQIQRQTLFKFPFPNDLDRRGEYLRLLISLASGKTVNHLSFRLG